MVFRLIKFAFKPRAAKFSTSMTIKNSLLVGETNFTFDPRKEITWYACGPTVYDSAHLGHARTYVCTDVIRRIFTNYFGLRVKFAMGITDIDDKIIHKGLSMGYDWQQTLQMAHQFENEFLSDMSELNVMQPDSILRVTDHIPEIISYIQQIERNNLAYLIEGDGVYFSVDEFGESDYGKLGSVPPVDKSNDTLSSRDKKRNPRDFVLWKAAKPGEPSWSSPWGPGRPGWHIECSAMTHSLFGPSVFVHSGGIDLLFPHHTNEIAQCEAHRRSPPEKECSLEGACCSVELGEGEGGCAGKGYGRSVEELTGRRCGGLDQEGESRGPAKSIEPDQQKEWVRLWLHTGHLFIEGRKMSKSLKNFLSVRDFLHPHPHTPVPDQASASSDGKNPGMEGEGSSEVSLASFHSISTDPGKDLRFYFLLTRYSAPLHLSMERLEDAVALRRKIEASLSVINTVLESEVKEGVPPPSRKPSPLSLALSQALSSCQSEVRAALSDDFDTGRCVLLLSSLLAQAQQYAFQIQTSSSLQTLPSEPLHAVERYVIWILDVLGLDSSSLHPSRHKTSRSAESIHDNGKSKACLDGLVQFRERIRARSIEYATFMKKSQKEIKKSSASDDLRQSMIQEGETFVEDVMKACDWVRDDLSPKLSIKIEDVSKEKSIWRPI